MIKVFFHRSQLINVLISKCNYKSYLEIGVNNGINFRNINCLHKVGVDPDLTSSATHFCKSDEFFANSKEKFDFIFIDGLHIKEQVDKDIINSLRCINLNGKIVIHDCNPIEEHWQEVPRKQQCWCGDVWKSFVHFKNIYNYTTYVVDVDYGCGIIECNVPFDAKIDDNSFSLEWKDLQSNRQNLLNLISPNDWLRYLEDEK